MAPGPLGQRYGCGEEDRGREVQGGLRGLFRAERSRQEGEIRPVRLRRCRRRRRAGLEPGLRQPERHPEQPLRRRVRGLRRFRRLRRLRFRRRPAGSPPAAWPRHPHARQGDAGGDRERLREGSDHRAQPALPGLQRTWRQERFRHQDLPDLQGRRPGAARDEHPVRPRDVHFRLPAVRRHRQGGHEPLRPLQGHGSRAREGNRQSAHPGGRGGRHATVPARRRTCRAAGRRERRPARDRGGAAARPAEARRREPLLYARNQRRGRDAGMRDPGSRSGRRTAPETGTRHAVRHGRAPARQGPAVRERLRPQQPRRPVREDSGVDSAQAGTQ